MLTKWKRRYGLTCQWRNRMSSLLFQVLKDQYFLVSHALVYSITTTKPYNCQTSSPYESPDNLRERYPSWCVFNSARPYPKFIPDQSYTVLYLLGHPVSSVSIGSSTSYKPFPRPKDFQVTEKMCVRRHTNRYQVRNHQSDLCQKTEWREDDLRLNCFSKNRILDSTCV